MTNKLKKRLSNLKNCALVQVFGANSVMGITGLLPLLKSVTKQVHVEQLAGQSVAIDAYSWLHKGIHTCIADIYHQRPTTA